MVCDGSVAPVIAALVDGCGVAARGMWPSPANSAEVGSSPIQPAPGTYASAQACRSVKSSLDPAGSGGVPPGSDRAGPADPSPSGSSGAGCPLDPENKGGGPPQGPHAR